MGHDSFTAGFGLLVVLGATSVLAGPGLTASTSPQPMKTLSIPQAKREPRVVMLHGLEHRDNYAWLQRKDSKEVLGYLREENAYTEAVMAPLQPFQEKLYREIMGRVQEAELSVPYRYRGYYYYRRTEPGSQYPVLCRKSAAHAAADDLVGATAQGPEQILLDLNAAASASGYAELMDQAVSDDASVFAFVIDSSGFHENILRFKNLRTQTVFSEAIPRVDNVAFAKGSHIVFYVTHEPQSKRSYRLYRHVIGTDPAKDQLVYEEKDERFYLSVWRTRSGDYLLASSSSLTTSEVRFLRADQPMGSWKIIAARQPGHMYSVEHRGALFYIRTNSPAQPSHPPAINYRVVTAPTQAPVQSAWQELQPHQTDTMVESIAAFSSFLVIRERADAQPRLRVVPLSDPSSQRTLASEVVQFPENLYALVTEENPDFESSGYRFKYRSFLTPDSVYDYDVGKRKLVLRKRQEVRRDFDPSRYVMQRMHGLASDGSRIPMSVVYRKDLKPDTLHPHPLLLWGYGAYGYPVDIDFSPARFSLLDRGVVFAVSHVRGGGDLGKRWHQQGRLEFKMNTFTDFISCAEALIKAGWTAQDRLLIQGASAGGMLIGAVANMRPDLFKAAHIHAGFVDVINTMLDESLPLTVLEFEEWGNPKIKASYDYIANYSPYDNIAERAYPSMLVTTSYNDSQVMYWESAKYVAKLRAHKVDKNPLLLRITLQAGGHAGSAGRLDRFRDIAFHYAFLLAQVGIDK